VTGVVGTFGWSEDPSTALAGIFHRRRSPFAENRFLQAHKGAENTKKKKSRQGFLALKVEEKGLSARG
jgi:hypothetical protein